MSIQSSDPTPETRAVGVRKSESKLQPPREWTAREVMGSMAPQPQASITPAPKNAPDWPTVSDETDPAPVEVRIGTIEIRAAPEPKPAPPKPSRAPVGVGFGDYWALRNYHYRWDR